MSRQGDVQAASPRGGPNILPTPTKQLHFRSLPDNTVVYRNLLINISQCMREHEPRPHLLRYVVKMTASNRDTENFKVAVRVRPPIPREVASGSTQVGDRFRHVTDICCDSLPCLSQCVEVDVARNTVVINKPVVRRRPSSRIGIDDFGELVRSDPSLVQSFTFDLVLGTRYTHVQ